MLRSRKGDAFIVGYTRPLIYDPPRQLDIFGSAAAYFGLEQLPGAQNIPSPKDLRSGEIGLRYTNTTKALGGVDHEKGIDARIVGCRGPGRRANSSRGSTAGSTSAPRLPWGNSSAWLYTHAGIVGGQRQSPLAAFYFGSFRNNYVDDRTEKRYRELESFPGFDIDEIAARRFAKVTGRDQPAAGPLRRGGHRRLLPELHSSRRSSPARWRPRNRDGGSRTYANVGAQLDLNFTVAMRLPMVLSVGAAAGFRDGDYRKTELLASLKIM